MVIDLKFKKLCSVGFWIWKREEWKNLGYNLAGFHSSYYDSLTEATKKMKRMQAEHEWEVVEPWHR